MEIVRWIFEQEKAPGLSGATSIVDDNHIIREVSLSTMKGFKQVKMDPNDRMSHKYIPIKALDVNRVTFISSDGRFSCDSAG